MERVRSHPTHRRYRYPSSIIRKDSTIPETTKPASMLVTAGLGISFCLVLIAVYCAWIRKPNELSNSRISTTSPRNILSAQEAVEIYSRKLNFMQAIQFEPRRLKNVKVKNECAQLAIRYRVSPKTILDVWNHKTWISATSHLWEPD